MQIHPDEFEDWRANPITRWVLQAVAREAANTRERATVIFFDADGFARGSPEATANLHFMRGWSTACTTLAAITWDQVNTIYAEADE